MTLLEKYRPRNLDEVYGHDGLKKLFRSYMEANDIPHLLLFGVWGTGKSSLIEAMLKEYYGKEYYYANVDTKNASRQSVRGIGGMDKIIDELEVTAPAGGFPFRIIVMEEADAITEAGQRSLKRAIEEKAFSTRFIFLTNYYSLMDEGITGRCVERHVKQPPSKVIEKLLRDIYTKETGNEEADDKTESIIQLLLKLKVGPRVAVKQLGVHLSGGSLEFLVTVYEKSLLINKRLFLSRTDNTKSKKLYKGIMDVYLKIRTEYPNTEREMLSHMHEDLLDNYFESHPVIVGELSHAMSIADRDIRDSTNPSIHMSWFLRKISKAFGV